MTQENISHKFHLDPQTSVQSRWMVLTSTSQSSRVSLVGFASIGAMLARCWSACTSELIQGLHCVPLHQTPLVKFFFFKIFIFSKFALLGKLYHTAGPRLNVCQILNGAVHCQLDGAGSVGNASLHRGGLVFISSRSET